MAKTTDFTKQVEEQREAAEKREGGGLTLEEHQKKVQEEEAAAQKAEQAKHMEEVEEAKKRAGFVEKDTDHTNDTDPLTGRTKIGDRDLGRDPATGGTVPPNGNNGNVPPNGERPTPPNGPTAAPMPQRPQQPKIGKEEFQGKVKSFFNADVHKGFWDTLENKIEKAFSGNTAEDIAQNMFFSAIELFFDMITNAINHRRKEKQKQKEEYMKTKEAYEKELGISTRHKKALALVLLAARQGIGPDQRPTKEQIAAMRADAKSAEFRNVYNEAMSTITGAERVKAEGKKDLEFVKKHNFGQVEIQNQVRGVKLNDPMFKTLGEKGTTALAQHVHGLYQACDAKEEQLAIDKEALRKARVNQAQERMQQQGRQGPAQQPSGRDAA